MHRRCGARMQGVKAEFSSVAKHFQFLLQLCNVHVDLHYVWMLSQCCFQLLLRCCAFSERGYELWSVDGSYAPDAACQGEKNRAHFATQHTSNFLCKLSGICGRRNTPARLDVSLSTANMWQGAQRSSRSKTRAYRLQYDP